MILNIPVLTSTVSLFSTFFGGGRGGSWLEHPVFSALVSNFTRREKEKEKRRPEIRLGSKAGGGGGGYLYQHMPVPTTALLKLQLNVLSKST